MWRPPSTHDSHPAAMDIGVCAENGSVGLWVLSPIECGALRRVCVQGNVLASQVVCCDSCCGGASGRVDVDTVDTNKQMHPPLRQKMHTTPASDLQLSGSLKFFVAATAQNHHQLTTKHHTSTNKHTQIVTKHVTLCSAEMRRRNRSKLQSHCILHPLNNLI